MWSTLSPSSSSTQAHSSTVDKQKAFNLMSAFYRVIYEVVLMIEIKWLMEKFNQDPLLMSRIARPPCGYSTSNYFYLFFPDAIYYVFRLILSNATSVTLSKRCEWPNEAPFWQHSLSRAHTQTRRSIGIVEWKRSKDCMVDGSHK